MGFLQRRLVKMVVWVVTYPKVTVGLCAMLLVVAVGYTWGGLKLSTDQNALLTPKLPFFKDYLRFDAKFPESEAFVVLVEPRDYGHLPGAKRWMALADEVSERLMGLKGVVKRVNSHVSMEELGDQAMLFADWEDVKGGSTEMRRILPLVKILGQRPGLEGVLLGSNFTERFYRSVGQGPAAEGADFATYITGSLNKAIKKPREQWVKGEEIPDLTDLDPRAKNDPAMYGYFVIPDASKQKDPKHKDDKIMILSVSVERDFSSLSDVTEPLKQMRAAVKEVEARYPEFKVGMTGRPALEADEMATSDYDMKVAEICGLLLVFVMLWLFLRNLWLVIVAEVCLGVGIGWTFGWATLAVGRLNLLSLVFVIALIGIGMDYLIQILTRFRFEKKRYVRPQAIWSRVFRYVSPPISTACLGAAGAFLVANLTDFAGAAELGVIAGGGLLLCLLSGYTLLPAMLTVFPANVGKVAEEKRYRDPATAGRAGGWRLIVPMIWVVVAVGGVFYAGWPKFDGNLLKLQAQRLESVKLVHKLPTWFAAVMTEDLEKLRKVRAALAPVAGTTVLGTESILDAEEKQRWLATHNEALKQVKWQEPGAPTEADLPAVADAAEGMLGAWTKSDGGTGLAGLSEQVRALVTELRDERDSKVKLERLKAWQEELFKELRLRVGQFTPGPLDVARLPATVRDRLISYREVQAEPRSERAKHDEQLATRATYVLYVYPQADLWDEGALGPFVGELERRVPGDVTCTGIAVQLFHSTAAIYRAFVLSTLYAVGLIFVLVLLDFRRLGQTLAAISVLVLGLPMLLLMMWLWRHWLHDPYGIPGAWNFANFFGLPILIGAGHEYGVFMVHRYRETLHDPRRVWGRWDVSDRALLLCAIVTSCSFGFLIKAEHRGLASLGWVMAVGSGCTYLATVLVLRPILQWRLQHKGVHGGTETRSRNRA